MSSTPNLAKFDDVSLVPRSVELSEPDPGNLRQAGALYQSAPELPSASESVSLVAPLVPTPLPARSQSGFLARQGRPLKLAALVIAAGLLAVAAWLAAANFGSDGGSDGDAPVATTAANRIVTPPVEAPTPAEIPAAPVVEPEPVKPVQLTSAVKPIRREAEPEPVSRRELRRKFYFLTVALRKVDHSDVPTKSVGPLWRRQLAVKARMDAGKLTARVRVDLAREIADIRTEAKALLDGAQSDESQASRGNTR